MGVIGTIIQLAIAIVVIVGTWKVYEKAGQPGWASIIPFYNLYILLKIVNKPWWWMLLFLVPAVNIVFIVWTYNLLSKAFGKGTGFTVGLVLLGFIFMPILGFGDAKYQGESNELGDPELLDSEQTK